MALRLELKMEKTDWVVPGRPSCQMRLTNEGDRAVALPHSRMEPIAPTLSIIQLHDGSERRIPPPRRQGKGTASLPPGKSLIAPIRWPREFPFSTPGEYEFLATLEDAGRSKLAESPPVRLRVRPMNVASLALDTLQGALANAAWVNLAEDPPQVMRGRIDLASESGLSDPVTIATATVRARPVLSLPANRADRRQPWVAWLDGNALKFTPHDPIAVQSLLLPHAPSFLIAPMFGDKTRAAALVCMSNSQLQVVRMTPAGGLLGPSLPLPGPCPVWSMNATFSRGVRAALLLQVQANETALAMTEWSDQSVTPPKTVAKWTGAFLGAGATLALDDTIRGAVLLGGPRPEWRTWEIRPDLEWREIARDSLSWPRGLSVRAERVRVSAQGKGAAILRDAQGRMFCCFGNRVAPLAGDPRAPTDLAFLWGGAPLLLSASAGMGVRSRTMRG